MKKMNKLIAVFIIIIMSLSLLNSCLNSLYEKYDTEPLKHLYLDGGTLEGYTPDMTINEVSKLTPTKEGYVFTGWSPDNYWDHIGKPGEIGFSWTHIENSELYAHWVKIPTEQVVTRKDEVLVTDDGVSKQHYDKIYFDSDGAPSAYIRAGYKTLKIAITLDVYSESTGNLYINFYRSSDCLSYYDFLPGVRFQDDSYIFKSQIDNEYGWNTITLEQGFPLQTLQGTGLYLRYEATSEFLQDFQWKNKNLSVRIWIE